MESQGNFKAPSGAILGQFWSNFGAILGVLPKAKIHNFYNKTSLPSSSLKTYISPLDLLT